MLAHCPRAIGGLRGHCLFLTTAVACLALATPSARAQYGTGTSTGSTATPTSTPAAAPSATTALTEVQAANALLSMEQLAAQFYTANAAQPYLAGTLPVTTGTPAPVVTPATGIIQPGGSGSANGTLFAATLSAAGEAKGVSNTASASASFLLSKDQTTVSYQITVTGLSGPATAVRIRQGPPGQANGIVLYSLALPTNGVSSGSFSIRPEDVPTLINGGLFLEITTAQNSGGEIRGQIGLASGVTAPTVITPPATAVTPTVVSASSTPGVLNSLVSEIQAGHNAHVAMLQQVLGTNASAPIAFQNLNAPTLSQFLTMAQSIEDEAVGVALNGIISTVPGASATTTTPASPSLVPTIAAILADDARYDGGLRAYVKTISTAEGGNPNVSLSASGQPFTPPVTLEQMNTFLQSFMVAAGGTGTGTATSPNSTASPSPTTGGTTSGGAAGTGTNPRPTVPPETTPSGGAAGTGTNPRPAP